MNSENESQEKKEAPPLGEFPDKPEQKDDPSRDEHHDESRRNAYDPEVAKAIGSAPGGDER